MPSLPPVHLVSKSKLWIERFVTRLVFPSLPWKSCLVVGFVCPIARSLICVTLVDSWSYYCSRFLNHPRDASKFQFSLSVPPILPLSDSSSSKPTPFQVPPLIRWQCPFYFPVTVRFMYPPRPFEPPLLPSFSGSMNCNMVLLCFTANIHL